MDACPTCGARADNPCTSFDMIGPGKPGPRYELDQPHAFRELAEMYWRAIATRIALLERDDAARDVLGAFKQPGFSRRVPQREALDRLANLMREEVA